MSTTSLEVMMRWYEDDPDLLEGTCPDCGALVFTDSKHVNRKLCDTCRDEHSSQSHKNLNDRKRFERNELIKLDYEEPSVNLAAAVIMQAARDAQEGDRDAWQFLTHYQGAALWLRCLGLEVTDKMYRRLQALGRMR